KLRAFVPGFVMWRHLAGAGGLDVARDEHRESRDHRSHATAAPGFAPRAQPGLRAENHCSTCTPPYAYGRKTRHDCVFESRRSHLRSDALVELILPPGTLSFLLPAK